MSDRNWPTWQVLAILILIIAATLFVLDGLLGVVLPQEIATAPTAVPTEPWPTPLQTRTATSTVPPTVTPVPTETPGPSATPTHTPSPTSTPSPTPTPTSTPRVIITDIKGLGRLETVQFVMQVVVDMEKEPNSLWQRVFGTDKILLIANGEVTAGFDLEAIEAHDITIKSDSVSIVLPPPEIFATRVDNSSTQVYMRETGFLVSPDKKFEGTARLRAERELLAWAEENAIRNKAEELGTVYLEKFLRSLGFTQITFIVETQL